MSNSFNSFFCSTYCKNLLEICNLADIERKIALYRAMFECNASGDRDPNYIKSEALMIELIAGGLSWQQQDYVISQLEPNEWREVSLSNCTMHGVVIYDSKSLNFVDAAYT